MTLNDIKDGFVIETVDGDRFSKQGETFVDQWSYFSVSDYNEDLTHKKHSDMDIKKVYGLVELNM